MRGQCTYPVFIAPARRNSTNVITPRWCRLVFLSGLKPGGKRIFGTVIKIFHCFARTDRLNDRVLIALTHSLNGTPVALIAS